MTREILYSDSDEVNGVQMDIPDGHSQTIEKILNWVKADGDICGKSVCDCANGVGSLAILWDEMNATNFYFSRLLEAKRVVQ